MTALNTQEDFSILEKNMDFSFFFNKLFSSKINRSKSESFATSRASLSELVILWGLMWITGGLKYLGVFLSDDILMRN